jgi:uncharacterized protein
MKKRFIAGAVCPRCAEMDKIVMYEQDGKNFRECVNCDYEDTLPVAVGANEILTRVQEQPVVREVVEQAIKIFEPDNY